MNQTSRKYVTKPLATFAPFLLLALVLLAACRDAAPGTAVAPGPVPSGAEARLGKGSLTSLVSSADGTTLIAGDRTGVSRYDGSSLVPRWATATSEPVQAVALSPDARWVLAGLSNGDLLLLDGASGELQSTLPGFDEEVGIESLAFGPSSGNGAPTFVAGYSNGQLLAGSAANDGLNPLGRLAAQGSDITAISFNGDGRILATGNRGGEVTLYDTATLSLLTRLQEPDPGQAVLSLAWNSAGDRLASGSKNGQIVVWDLLRLTPLAQLPRQESAIISLDFPGDESRLGAVTAEGTFLAWDSTAGSLGPIRRAGSPAIAAAWNGDGTRAWIALKDGRLQHRAVTNGLPDAALVAERHDHAPAGAQLNAMALSPDGARLATGLGREVVVWDVARRAVLARLGGHESSVTAAAWSPDGRFVASADRQGAILIHTVAGDETHRLADGAQAVSDLAWSPDGKLLAAAEALSGTVTLWDPAGGVRQRAFAAEGPGLWSVAWSPDGTQLLAGGVDGRLHLFEVAGGPAPQDSFWRHLNWVGDIAWPAAAKAASASADTNIILWDLSAGNSQRLAAHTAPVRGVAYNPLTTRLASGGLDHQLIVWDTDPRAAAPIVTRLLGHTAGITAVAWTPDGRAILSGSEDGTVIVWPAPLE